MAGDKPAQTPNKGQPKVVPVGDLIAYKKSAQERERKLREELAKANTENASLRTDVEKFSQISELDTSDEVEVKRVQKLLLDEAKELKKERGKLGSDLAGFKEREKSIRAKELYAELKGKGVEIEESALMDAEDMEAKATDLYVEHLAKENDELKHKEPESLYESETPTIIKKDFKSMPEKEFQESYKSMKQEALSKR